MQLHDYFYPVYLPGNPVFEQSFSNHFAVLNLDTSWRNVLQKIGNQAQNQRMPGLLFLQTTPKPAQRTWFMPDHLLEHLECRPWDLLYFSYAMDRDPPDSSVQPAWERCDMPPAHVSAMALRCDLVSRWLDVMPDHAHQKVTLNVEEWFSISSWIATGVAEMGQAWAIWPPLAPLVPAHQTSQRSSLYP